MKEWIWIVFIVVALLIGGFAGYYMANSDDVVGAVGSDKECAKRSIKDCNKLAGCKWDRGSNSCIYIASSV